MIFTALDHPIQKLRVRIVEKFKHRLWIQADPVSDRRNFGFIIKFGRNTIEVEYRLSSKDYAIYDGVESLFDKPDFVCIDADRAFYCLYELLTKKADEGGLK